MEDSKIKTNFLSTYNNITKDCRMDFLYTCNTYSGVYISSRERLKKEEEDFINQHKSFFTQHLNYNKPIPIEVIKCYQEDYPELLKPRVCMTLLTTDDCKEIGVIWYDDNYYIEPVKSLANIFNKIDWTKAQKFEY
jgi:hypothetical protein